MKTQKVLVKKFTVRSNLHLEMNNSNKDYYNIKKRKRKHLLQERKVI